MPKKRSVKKTMGGKSLREYGQQFYGYLNDAYTWAKKTKPAHKILSYIPEARNVPYIGSALSAAESAGFGGRRIMGGTKLMRARKG
jgi:hypothetical protein